MIYEEAKVRIIKKGVDPKTHPVRFTCLNCDTVFETSQQDAKCIEAYSAREGAYWQHDCPVCKQPVASSCTVRPGSPK